MGAMMTAATIFFEVARSLGVSEFLRECASLRGQLASRCGGFELVALHAWRRGRSCRAEEGRGVQLCPVGEGRGVQLCPVPAGWSIQVLQTDLEPLALVRVIGACVKCLHRKPSLSREC